VGEENLNKPKLDEGDMDVRHIRDDFPLLRNESVVYLDSACQSLKPESVLKAMDQYNREFPACGGRSVHRLANRVSMEVDMAREKIAQLIGSPSPDSIVFTKNCTEAINTVARGLGLSDSDTVVTTDIEHNSNHIPWLRLAQNGVKRRIVATDNGILDIEGLQEAMSSDVRLVSMVHTSNVTGTTLPAKEVVEIAHEHGALVMLDGAQYAGHAPLDLERLDVDFYTVSIQKTLGPTGLGVLYGKEELLKNLEPLSVGGGTVGLAEYNSVELLPPPERFEGGLLNYAAIIGAGAAADYLMDLGVENIEKHELMLQKRLQKRIEGLEELSVVGPAEAELRGGITSFNIKGLGSHDVAMILDEMGGILLRSGMHCCHPWFRLHGIPGCARASLHLYNNERDIDRFADALEELVSTFSR